MLLDLLTLMLILKARDEIAFKQFLSELVLRLDDNYAATLLTKGVGLAGNGAREWVVGVY